MSLQPTVIAWRPYNQISEAKELESQSENVHEFMKLSRDFQNKVYSSVLSQEYNGIICSEFDRRLTPFIRKGIRHNDADEENIQKILAAIKKISECNKCKEFTLVIMYATAYLHENKATMLIPIIRVEWKKRFTVNFLSKTGKKFNSINELVRSIDLPQSLVCFPRHGTYQLKDSDNGIALEFSTIHFYGKPFYKKILESITPICLKLLMICSFVGAGLFAFGFATFPNIFISGSNMMKISWISCGISKVLNWMQVCMNRLGLTWLFKCTSSFIRSIAHASSGMVRAGLIRKIIFNGLWSFVGLALELGFRNPSSDLEKEAFIIKKTGQIFKYPFSSAFNFNNVISYDVEMWRSYVAEILKKAETLMQQKGGNFKRKLWFVNCYIQEQTCSQFSEGKNSLNEFLKLEKEEIKSEENFKNADGFDDDSDHDIDFIVIYHDDDAKKCVYIFQTEFNTLISQGKVVSKIETDCWTEVYYEKNKCLLRKFNHENVEYVCVVEDYKDAETILPWPLLLGK